MLSIKRIHKYLVGLALLVVVISFSGFTRSASNYNNPQTELLANIKSKDNSKVAPYKTIKSTSQKVWFNQYIVFNFKSLLNIHYFDFSLTLKSQKARVLEFLNPNGVEQHLMAHVNSEPSDSILLD